MAVDCLPNDRVVPGGCGSSKATANHFSSQFSWVRVTRMSDNL